ncbi:hypothetical protein LUZ60_001749 [Juncus effusus]|nr:hypothetical protein LUZ60_001749 [Juncus effusus]
MHEYRLIGKTGVTCRVCNLNVHEVKKVIPHKRNELTRVEFNSDIKIVSPFSLQETVYANVLVNFRKRHQPPAPQREDREIESHQSITVITFHTKEPAMLGRNHSRTPRLSSLIPQTLTCQRKPSRRHSPFFLSWQEIMAPKKDSKAPPASKPAKSGGGKQKKKKWSKGKQKEKVNNAVLFDQATYDKMLTEVPKFKQITPSILSERLRVNGSLARRAIKDLMARGAIRMVAAHSSQQIYTRATNT